MNDLNGRVYFMSLNQLIESRIVEFDNTFKQHVLMDNGWTVRTDYIFSNPKAAILHSTVMMDKDEINKFKKSKCYIKYILLPERIKKIGR